MKTIPYRISLIGMALLLVGCPIQNTDSAKYRILYDGNGHTSGSAPVDTEQYIQGSQVIVLGNTGNLLRIQDGISLLFTGWNTQSNGSGSSYTPGQILTVGTADVILYAQWSAMRATGPAGGLVFYDKGAYSAGWRYLEAAPSDQSNEIQWGGEGTAITGADGTAIGTGFQNTIDIVTQLGTSTSYAARLCYELDFGGFSDWFLPSKDELVLIYQNLMDYGVGSFPDYYWWWSSSEYNSTMAWEVYYDGTVGYVGKAGYSVNHVRAVHRF